VVVVAYTSFELGGTSVVSSKGWRSFSNSSLSELEIFRVLLLLVQEIDDVQALEQERVAPFCFLTTLHTPMG
jgi:hypothetical protein